MEKNSGVKRIFKLVTNLIISLIILLSCIFLLPKIIVFFTPFVVGWIIACIANPLVGWLEKRLKIKRKAGTVVVVVVVLAAVVGLLYLIFSILTRQLLGFIEDIPQMWETLVYDFNNFGKEVNRIFGDVIPSFSSLLDLISESVGVFIGKLPQKLNSNSFQSMGSMVGNIANVIIAIIMSMLSAYFFISDREWVSKFTQKYVPKSIYKKFDIFSRSIKLAVGGYFKAQFKIEIWMYILVLVGLSVFKVRYVILIALLIAFLDFFPFFGTGAILLPWAIISVISGEYVRAIGFVAIWGIGQLVRQLIQPKIMGDSIGMDPIPTLFLLYIGYKVAGVFGMLIAVPLGIIVVNMNDAGFFDTPKSSLKILVAQINRFRKLDKADYDILKEEEK